MANAFKKGSRISPQESAEWLQKRMRELGIVSLGELEIRTGIDKGSLSRYFRQERTPGIDVIAPLCEVLEVSPESLLVALGALSRRGK